MRTPFQLVDKILVCYNISHPFAEVNTMSRDWFTVEPIDEATFMISEYGHWEQTHCYLLVGLDRALLIDTGLGVGDISAVAHRLTDKPVTAAATHVHWDHIGGHKYFSDICVHAAEKEWLSGNFPLPAEAVRAMLTRDCRLPGDFKAEEYQIFRGTPSRLLVDGDSIDLGGREVQVLHTPGHSPGHLCFWEAERGYLFTGDLVYEGTLFANYPSTDPDAFLSSLKKISALPAKRMFPGHHSPDIQPELCLRMRDGLRKLKAEGKLRHGSGEQLFSDWSIIM